MYGGAELRNGKEQVGGGSVQPAGQVRVLVVGDSGVGKSSLVNLIVNGKPTKQPHRTVGCHVSVKYVEYADKLASDPPAPSSSILPSVPTVPGTDARPCRDEERKGYFVELWDVSGNELYNTCRPLFYSQVNGVIFVHDLSRRKSRVSALRWLGELARTGTFSAPSNPSRPGSLPVPLLVIGNKEDIRERDPVQRGTTSLWNAIQRSRTYQWLKRWAEHYQLMHIFGFRRGPELPEYIRNPHAAGLIACAKEGRLDMRAVSSFFNELIERRYFTEQLQPLPSPSSSFKNPYFSASYSPTHTTSEASFMGAYPSPRALTPSSSSGSTFAQWVAVVVPPAPASASLSRMEQVVGGDWSSVRKGTVSSSSANGEHVVRIEQGNETDMPFSQHRHPSDNCLFNSEAKKKKAPTDSEAYFSDRRANTTPTQPYVLPEQNSSFGNTFRGVTKEGENTFIWTGNSASQRSRSPQKRTNSKSIPMNSF